MFTSLPATIPVAARVTESAKVIERLKRTPVSASARTALLADVAPAEGADGVRLGWALSGGAGSAGTTTLVPGAGRGCATADGESESRSTTV